MGCVVGEGPPDVEVFGVKKRQIELVTIKGKLSEWTETQRVYEPAEAVILVEELRRMMPEITGDPDQPIERVVFRRRLT